MHWDYALILLFFGVAVPILGRRRIERLLAISDTTKTDRLTLYASTIAFQWMATGVILWRTTAHGVLENELGIGIFKPALTIFALVILSALLIANQLASLKLMETHPEAAKGRLQQVALKIFPRDTSERLVFVALVVTVAICEEFIYRGFVQFVFRSWSGNLTWVAIFGAAALFAISHLYQGRRGVLTTFVVGMIFSGVRAWTGSLVPSIVAHFFTDLIVGIGAPSRIRGAILELPEKEAFKQ